MMKNQASDIQKYILQNIPKHPHDIVSRAIKQFNVSRTTILRHIQHLVNQNKVIKTGTTKQITYALSESLNQKFTIKLDSKFDEYQIFTTYLSSQLITLLNQNAYEICEYVLTEMLNNCYDHSRGTSVEIEIEFMNDTFCCTVSDNGIGVFENLASYLSMDNIYDVFFELSKGKLTTDPSNHTGEGLFFSARAVDKFILSANGFEFFRDNLDHDWTFAESELSINGTKVAFEININTQRQLETLFHQYTHDLSFSKTDILVDLSKHIGERLISRSQAKRVVRHLQEFSHITLDFKHVKAVGQGFIDQLFRVYQNDRPELTIRYINANKTIEYMIQRCLAAP